MTCDIDIDIDGRDVDTEHIISEERGFDEDSPCFADLASQHLRYEQS